MRLLLLFFLIGTNFTLIAQNKGKLQGIVHSADSTALEKATVSIVDPQDSSILSYTLTNTNGKFEFVRIPQQKGLMLYISHVNAHPFQKEFMLDKETELDFGTIRLEGKSLDEVVVTAAPIRMNQDTLEYNAAYFKVRPNANVEELLKELPGLQVNMDGTIYYEGKEVSSVKVDGKDFFATDTRIATRNLDASLIKTIQVYRDRGESKKNVDDEENLPISINLKFKNEFLRTDFGKAYASGGSRERYESGALFNTFRDTMQVSLIAFGNNINRESFDYNELNQHAGLGRAENHGFNDFGGQNYWGIGNDIAGGVNFNNDWGRNPKLKSTKLNIMYMYRYKKQESNNDGNSIFRLEDQQQYSNYMNNALDKSNNHNIRTLLRHRFDSTAYMEFRPEITFNYANDRSAYSSETKNDIHALTQNNTTNTNKNSNTNYSHRFYLEKQFSKAHVMSFTNTFNFNDEESDAISDHQMEMYQTAQPSTAIWDNIIRNTRNNNMHWSAAYYNKMVEKLTFDLYLTLNNGLQSPLESFYYDRDNNGIIRGTQYENNYKFYHQDYISGIRFSWKPIKKLIVNFGTAYQIKHTEFDFIAINRQKEQTNQYWLPNINIRYKDLNLGWSQDVQNPAVYNIQTQVNDLNPMYKRLQSLDFGNILTQRTFIGYNRYKPKYQVGGRISMDYRNNSTGYKSWRNMDTGHNISQSYQSGDTRSFNGYAFFRYNFKSGKDWQYYISTRPSFYTHQHYQTINDIENRTTGIGWNFNQELSIRWKDLIGIAPKYSLRINQNKNSVKDNADFRETNYLVHDYGMGININPIKGFSLEATYSLQNRASGMNSRANYNIVNSSLYYTLKNNSQLKLSAFDILNQNVQNHWGMSANSTYYYNSITLRQYFLLGYIYKFNMTKTK
ncbi:MAG TPA: hypothetical protein PKA53_05515 [Sphingobacterium sp.]|nr:hypothetical protein [Sphingobacterium sp.]